MHVKIWCNNQGRVHTPVCSMSFVVHKLVTPVYVK